MDIRLIGPPEVIQAWAGMLRDQYGVKTTLMRSRKSEDLRCYAHMDDEHAGIQAARYATSCDTVVDIAPPPTGES